MRMLSAERLIIDAGLFGFSAEEIADNIDAAIRLRLVAVVRTGGLGRLLSRVLEGHGIDRQGGFPVRGRPRRRGPGHTTHSSRRRLQSDATQN